MKLIFSFILSLFICLGISAQPGYYFNTIFSAGQNPGNLNNDPEEPLGFTAGYDTLISANALLDIHQFKPYHLYLILMVLQLFLIKSLFPVC